MPAAPYTKDLRLLGLTALERTLKEEYPDCAVSRHILYRLCANGHLPHKELPAGTPGGLSRFRVVVADAVKTIRSFSK